MQGIPMQQLPRVYHGKPLHPVSVYLKLCPVQLSGTLHYGSEVYPSQGHQLPRRHSSASRAAGRGSGSSKDDEIWGHLAKVVDKYILGSPQGTVARISSSNNSGGGGSLPIQSIHILLSCMCLVWLLTSTNVFTSGPLLPARLLSLEHFSSSSTWFHRWWCPLTDAFISPNSQLLARNLFFGYMFGRVVQNTEGSGALWLNYILAAAGGSCAALLLLPRRAPIQGCAASAALFGLFAAAAIFNRHKSWHWQRVFELGVLLPFVLQQLLSSHAGLAQWCTLAGLRLPGGWVPLLGGLLGAAVAAALLAAVRAINSSIAARQRQQRQRRQAVSQQQPAQGTRDDDEVVTPVPVLLGQAAAQLLKRGLGI